MTWVLNVPAQLRMKLSTNTAPGMDWMIVNVGHHNVLITRFHVPDILSSYVDHFEYATWFLFDRKQLDVVLFSFSTVYCPSGQELQGMHCVLCSRGYWKDNTIDVHMLCMPCDPDYITASEGATSQTECNVRKCQFSLIHCLSFPTKTLLHQCEFLWNSIQFNSMSYLPHPSTERKSRIPDWIQHNLLGRTAT